MQLSGKVAIVTGTGRGIGRAIARRFAAEGAAVLLAARTESELKSAAAEIADGGGRVAWVAADVSREPDCERILRAAIEKFGQVNILVNNAGIYGPVKPIRNLTRGVGFRRDVESARCFPAYAAPAAGVLRARRRRSTQHLKHCGEGSSRLGSGLCRS